MKKLVWGGLLVVLAVFMLVGFLNADVDPYSPAVVAALVITVGLPALGAGALFRSHLTGKAARAERKNRLLDA